MNPDVARLGRLAAVVLLAAGMIDDPRAGAEPATPPGSAATGPIDVWLDVDPGTGISDVDDGLMLLQAFHSPELQIRGVSVVFGNAPLDKGVAVAREIVGRFGPADVRVYRGAAASGQRKLATPAVEALAAALRERRLTVLAVGPLTNIAALIEQHPGLVARIERLVMVAARRPGQRFVVGPEQKVPFRDFNFECDPEAMEVVLATEIPLAFAPWEVSSQVWITRDDLAALRMMSDAGRWIADTSDYWIERWEKTICNRGFNPFDTLALGFVTHPRLVRSLQVSVRIERGPDDRAAAAADSPPPQKPYLLVEPHTGAGRAASYCYEPLPEFKTLLIARLAGSDLGE